MISFSSVSIFEINAAPQSPQIIAAFKRGNTIFLLTGLRIYTGEYKAQGPTLCPTKGRALRGPRALYSPV